ncbi:ammonium transporter [Paenochrobactrum sp. BZR 588]|uniref:ammonium transporter n=1 Tax=unclassified Paenochrobactrum TaxID=2639760 RepID=UPI003853238A
MTLIRVMLVALATLLANKAMAQDISSVADTGDTAWMLTATVLVLMMTIPGVALFYGGMVRRKNVLATTMQSFAIACVASVCWMVAGYSLAFSDGGAANAFIGGLSNTFFAGVTPDSLTGTIPEYVFITFQMTFAIITPALIAGAFAERMKFSALLIFTVLWLFIVYVPVAHWVWGGGFLGGDGVLDFAGGTVVHINSGVAGLVVALMIGKRDGYGQVNMAPHNLVYSLIGASLLWVGWFGFNAGSAGGANGIAAVAMINTQIAAAGAALSWMVVEWLINKRPSVLGIISGAVAGLVGVTPAAGFVNPAGALMIGLASGAGCYFAAVKFKHWLGYDDSLDAFGVHGVGGIIGAILTGVFADAAINPLSEGATVFKQLYGVAVTMLYTAVMTALIVVMMRMFMEMRVSKATEIEGLDINLHGETVHS